MKQADMGASDDNRRYHRAYRAAMRHSRLVRFLKVFIPVGSVALVAGIAVAMWLDPFRDRSGVGLTDIQISGKEVTMESPVLTGFSSRGFPYRINALKAVQDLENMHILQLTGMDAAFITDEEQSSVRILSDEGTYDTRDERLDIRGNILVTTSDNQQMMLESAFIDMRSGAVSSVEPVTVLMSDGEIRSRGLEIFDNGNRISFRRNVDAVFYDTGSPVQEERPVSPSPEEETDGADNDGDKAWR
ncbi:MAG: LPS export ABC transporter periplasmic protein LptC [Methylobacteriaceae bacterium]|jgi:lipopolysaccharide export system protein LptC|nr:LPS export ABC transporter periplasmic protein LptC [Methylobacteriaceae bacterium]